jgi:DNA-binding CsgD family transcriptional regulator
MPQDGLGPATIEEMAAAVSVFVPRRHLEPPAPGLGHADLVACLKTLHCLGVAFGAGGQPDRAGPLHGAAEVLRELLDRMETPVRPGRHAFVDLWSARRTAGSGRLATQESSLVARPRSPHRHPRTESAPVGAGRAQTHPRPLLSPRERDVLVLLAEGCSNAVIARALGIGQRTAETHVAHILGKFGVASRTAAVAYAGRHGLIK